MGKRITAEEADALFRTAGLEPVSPYEGLAPEREATCMTCGTWRRVTLRNLKAGGIACRWCDGWAKWGRWGEQVRPQYASWRAIRGADFSASQIAITGLLPITPLGDEFTPVGCLCLRCGETLVTVPERIDERRPDWFSCARCHQADNLAAGDAAEAVYEQAGLRLLDRVRGRWTPMPCECLRCGSLRHVTYMDALNDTGPACWSCRYGIDPYSPHRVYLFRFPELGVLKVGITHSRHDGRLVQHQVNGGELLQAATVPDRATALAVEAWVLATKRPWLRASVGPQDFPQGGWTEAWSEADSPAVDLAEVCSLLGAAQRPAAH